MTIEERLKVQIGELVFANCALQAQGEAQAKQLAEAQQRIKELEDAAKGESDGDQAERRPGLHAA